MRAKVIEIAATPAAREVLSRNPYSIDAVGHEATSFVAAGQARQHLALGGGDAVQLVRCISEDDDVTRVFVTAVDEKPMREEEVRDA